ncbi:MAG: type-F conjugative transfer system secretin TraK [Alphaproteobacteria bacterium]|nr:type-F conjugative transfer system secretin TraK [Alphaproteobacteria bacterium]
MVKHLLTKTRFQVSCVLIINVLVVPQTFALKEYPLIDQHQVNAVISNREINRITVVHDRIRQVFGADGTFSHEVDEEGGQLFIKPLKPQQTKPIHITIVTENGLTQDLKLNLADIDAETIVLRQTETSSSPSLEPGKNPLIYLEALLQLVQAMGRSEDMAGFQKSKEGEKRIYSPHLKTKVRAHYKGSLWQGWVFDLYNTSESSLELKEQDFARSNDLAIALQDHRLNPQGCTRLYIVSRIQGEI